MRDALAADFARRPGTRVVVSGLPDGADGVDDEVAFRTHSAEADWSVVIAPESRGLLEERYSWARAVGARVLGPSPGAVARTTNKLTLAAEWQAAGVPTPDTRPVDAWPAGRFPCVIKPFDGAGSFATFLTCDDNEFAESVRVATLEGEPAGRLIAQDYVPGRAASIAFMVGPTGALPLLPTFQRLSHDGRFRYEGGVFPISPNLAGRAVDLGRRAIAGIHGLFGYVGVDLVLGAAADGSADRAIEINPRFTTSYIGLRTLANTNLADLLLRVARGENVSPPVWKAGRASFGADGSVSYAASSDT